ncbi:MAG: hypothetical protein KDA57_11035 [Planctomycetales bacterium]|nr:hypothetical protein [Planctomycetales bacterium]
MKLSRKARLGSIVLGLLVLFAGSAFVLPREYPTEQTATLSFVIEEDFTKVRKIMVRTDAAKEIVTMGGGSEFVEQTWEGGNVDAGAEKLGEALLRGVLSSDPDWRLELNGKLKVRTLDEYVGQNVVTLQQNVEIVPDHIQSDTILLEGSERLLGYEMTTRLEREGEHSRVTLKLTQEIKTEAPWFAHGIADRRVRASVEKTLANQEAAMRKLIADNRDANWLFPLY